MKRPSIRIVEINVYRSKKNSKIGHAVALLFPCCHNKYLGLTLYKGAKETNRYRTQDCRIIKLEDCSINEKSNCKLCPPDDYWLDDLVEDTSINDFVEVLESMDID